MKTKLFTLFFALAAGVGTMFAYDQTTKIGDLYYNLNAGTKTAEVTYEIYMSSDNYKALSGELSIPESVTYNSVSYSVTSIGYYAFLFCGGLTSVTIPNSVTSIGKYAFNMVPNIVYDGTASGSPWGARSMNGFVDGWFVYSDNTKTTLLACFSTATGEITIPNSVTEIGWGAFFKCTGLTSVTIPNSVTSIGNEAFESCTGLTSVTIPNSVTSIGNEAFESCTGLTSVTIPNSVTSIGDGAFRGCSGLTSVTIPNSVTSIGEDAFSYCTGLTSVTIPNSVTSIGGGAFRGCSGLTSVVVENGNTIYDSRNNCNAIIETATNTLIVGCKNTIIPNSVTSIGRMAFEGCTGLTSVTIPNSVTSIGGGAFYGCTGLTSVTIPNSVTNIGNRAFRGCSGLTSVTIPNSVTSIGEGAFDMVPNIVYDGTASGSPWGARSMNGFVDGWLVYTDNTKTTLLACSSAATGEITIPNSVTSIGDKVFYGCSGLTSIYVPCGEIERFKQMLSDYSDKVKYEPLPSVEVLVNNPAAGKVTIPQNPTICDNPLTMEAVSNYGYHFVQWSDGVKENPRTVELTQDTAFTAEFAVDRSGTCGDNNALRWTYDVEAKVLTISGIGTLNSHYTFGAEAPEEMEKLIIAEGVTSVGNSAFANRTTLQHISLPTTVKTIYEQAFYNCTGLTHIFCYREKPSVAYSNTFDGIDKFECTLHVLSASVDMYKAATGWRDFYYIETIDAGTETEPVEEVTVTPTETTANIIWPLVQLAASYEITIRDLFGNVIFRLVFNAQGQLTGISFAPSRNKQHEQVEGFNFTVTGLSSGTAYTYSIVAKDNEDKELDTKQGTFQTTSNDPMGIDEISTDKMRKCENAKIMRDGVLYIERDGVFYNAQGTRVE